MGASRLPAVSDVTQEVAVVSAHHVAADGEDPGENPAGRGVLHALSRGLCDQRTAGQSPCTVSECGPRRGPIRLTYHYRSHRTERVEHETVAVDMFIGRMVQHTVPKGFKRIRYDGVQATSRAPLRSSPGSPIGSGMSRARGAIPYGVPTVRALWTCGVSGTRPTG